MELNMNAVKHDLFWEQPRAMERRFILSSGEDIIGKLDFRSAFSSLGEAVLGSDRWSFKRVGFWSPKVSVRRIGSTSDLALYHPKWTGSSGEIQFSTRELFSWSAAGILNTRYTICRKDENELITISREPRKEIRQYF
jgi:hypothetical protein